MAETKAASWFPVACILPGCEPARLFPHSASCICPIADMAHYLVTGAAGFIAGRVAKLLLERGDMVTGVDNLNDAYDVRLKEWRLRQLETLPGFSYMRGDITD